MIYTGQYCPSYDNTSTECVYQTGQEWSPEENCPYYIVEDFNYFTGESIVILSEDPGIVPFNVENINGERKMHWYELSSTGWMFDYSNYENVCLKVSFSESNISLEDIDFENNENDFPPILNSYFKGFLDHYEFIEPK